MTLRQVFLTDEEARRCVEHGIARGWITPAKIVNHWADGTPTPRPIKVKRDPKAEEQAFLARMAAKELAALTASTELAPAEPVTPASEPIPDI
jgi:hypothetical protein